jgi:carbonyl reductase 1
MDMIGNYKLHRFRHTQLHRNCVGKHERFFYYFGISYPHPIFKMTKICVVTGSNKGIGFHTAQRLGLAGFKVILACRNQELGNAAAAELVAQGVDAECRLLDIMEDSSVDDFASSIANSYGKIDLLVNNVGMAFKGKDPTPFGQQAAPCIGCNFFGTLRVTSALLPLINAGGRVVNMASESGHLKVIKGDELRAQFSSAELTLDALVTLMNKYVHDAEAGIHEEQGWSSANLGTSKVGVVALTKVLARAHPDLTVVCCCPGHCKTDMSSMNGTKTAEEGSITPFYAATSADVVSGQFYADEKPIEW